MSLFTRDLLELVRRYLLPAVTTHGYQISGYEPSRTFDNANVVLECDPVRVRVVRERGQMFVDFAGTSHPELWFDSHVVLDQLNPGSKAGWQSENLRKALRDLGEFIELQQHSLAALFSSPAYEENLKLLLGRKKQLSDSRWE